MNTPKTDSGSGPTLTSVSTPTRVDFDVWSTTATLVLTDPAGLDLALAELTDELAGIEATCSRFRPESEINRLLATPDRDVTLSPVLNDAITHALRVASATDYLVDPTVAAAVIAIGYDRDIADVVAGALAATGPAGSLDQPAPTMLSRAAPGAARIRHDPATATMRVPAGVGIDLGATAKALAADRAAARIARAVSGGVLVGIGGDIAVAGPAPAGGWRVSIADDHRDRSVDERHQLVSIVSGGLATSSTLARRWRTSAGWAHHIVDPRTGRNPAPTWRTVSVAAGSCVDANAAATASIVLGGDAPAWLISQGLPALLVAPDGVLSPLGGWPARKDAA